MGARQFSLSMAFHESGLRLDRFHFYVFDDMEKYICEQ
jgi:hypothetical protein